MSNWSWTINPFLSITEKSYYTALAISTFHDNALQVLKADTFIAGLYATFHPLHVAFKTSYDAWLAHNAIQQGETMNFTNLLEKLSSDNIQKWDIYIQYVHNPKTVEYKKILPNKRKPFQTGTQLERLHATQAFAKNVAADAALVTIKPEVELFMTQLETAYNTQKGSLNATKTLSDNVEAARKNMGVAMFANLGGLIQKYTTNAAKVESFFDMKIMRRTSQTFFTGYLDPLEVYNVVKHTFTDKDEVYIRNTGDSVLQVYLSASKDGRPAATAYKIAAGEQTVLVKLLGNIADSYLMVYNMDSKLKGGFEVELL